MKSRKRLSNAFRMGYNLIFKYFYIKLYNKPIMNN